MSPVPDYHGWPPGNPNHPDYAPAKTSMSWRNALGMWGGLIMAMLCGAGDAASIAHQLSKPTINQYAWAYVGVLTVLTIHLLGYSIGVAIKGERITWQ